MMRLIFFVFITLSFNPLCLAQSKGATSIYDYAEVLSPQQEAEIESKFRKFKFDNGTEFILVFTKDEVKQNGDAYAASFAHKKYFNQDVLVLSADVMQHVYGFYVRGPLEEKFPKWMIDKIEDNIKINYRENNYFEGVNGAVENVIGISGGTIQPKELKRDPSNQLFIALLFILIFFIIIFPIFQFYSMRKKHFGSRPLDFVSSVLLFNTFGTRGKNQFDSFSNGKGAFAIKDGANTATVGGGGVEGFW